MSSFTYRNTIKISVVIPVYRDSNRVRACIRWLEGQTLSPEAFEVVVVNNDPSEELDVRSSRIKIKIVVEPKPGSYAARNAGIRNSEGEILAFTDADCTPRPDWLTRGLEAFSDVTVDRVAGAVLPDTPIGDLTWAGKYDALFGIDQERYARRGVAATANLFVRRRVFDALGGFDEHFYSGGDFHWNKRANDAGYSILYLDTVVVEHKVRDSFVALLKKNKRVLAGTYRRNEKATISLLRAVTPPVQCIRQLWSKGVSLSTGAEVAWVSYCLKVHRYVLLRRLRAGKVSVER